MAGNGKKGEACANVEASTVPRHTEEATEARACQHDRGRTRRAGQTGEGHKRNAADRPGRPRRDVGGVPRLQGRRAFAGVAAEVAGVSAP